MPESDPATRALLTGRVGGTFWGAASLCRRPVIISAPPVPSLLAHLWHSAKHRHDPRSIGVVMPHQGARWPTLRRAIAREGGAIIDQTADPFTVLDHTREILTGPEGLDALTALGGLFGLPVTRLKARGTWHDAPDTTLPRHALALLHRGTTYRCPFSGHALTAAEAIALLTEWRHVLTTNRTIAVCVGMSFWKRRRISAFFATADHKHPHPVFRRSTAGALAATPPGSAIACWATRLPPTLAHRAARRQVPLYRVEDGFIRSSGLGSGFLPPASIIMDRRGAYYDPTQPSDLEVLLATHPLDEALQSRARTLTTAVIAQNISKYSGDTAAPKLTIPPGRRVILVPGQVADDLSVRLGGGAVGGNLALLARVRAARPEGYIIYRPHPDVDAGHRAGALTDEDVLRHADVICREGAMTRLLERVDEVHTLTSLTGFEALMRNKPVTTYGQPFYAGWGLTEDHAPLPRRTRKLTIDQLIAATLLLYPRYVDPLTHLPCGPEILIERFGRPDLWRPSPLMQVRRLQGIARKAVSRRLQAITRPFLTHRDSP